MREKGSARIALEAVAICLAFVAGWLGKDLLAPVGRDAASTQARVSAENGILRFQGETVHPGCVRKLLPDPAAGPWLPGVASVDLASCQKSLQRIKYTVGERLTPPKGFVRFEAEHLLGRNAFFGYRHLGVLPSGTHVLKTCDCGGGSGAFMNLLLVRFETRRIHEDGRPRDRVLMTCVGHMTLTDRYDGEIRIEGDRIRIGKTRFRPEDWPAEVVVKPE